MRIETYSDKDFNKFAALFQHWDKDLEVHREALRAQLHRAAARPENHILLAVEGDSVPAYVQTRDCFDIGFEPYVEIVQLLVKKTERSKGLGTRLLNEVERTARGRGLSAVKLHSNIMRSRAHVFYERNGYTFYKCSKFYEKKLDA
jgi:GNAT superfamily N-acetyltransferase